MDMADLCNTVGKRRKRKRVGRGNGSGHGKTSCRGHRGARCRSGARRRWGAEGGQMPLFRRLPKKGFSNKPFQKKYDVVNVQQLQDFEAGTSVDLEVLEKKGVLKSRYGRLKILGTGDLSVALKVKANRCSASAREKIEKAGGTVEMG